MSLAPELFRALGVLCEAPEPAHARPAAALGLSGRANAEDHAELFVFQLVPYASVYLGPDGMLGGEARDRVAGFWRALRLTPPPEPDHLAALLGLYASLAERERAEPEPARRLMWHHARRTLLWEHLLTWVPPYAHAVTTIASGFHATWARLLSEALAAEARELKAPLALARPRHVSPLPDAGTKTFIRALLTPARSGLIITRHDLACGARTMGLGMRMGERAFILRSLIDQDPAVTFGWLADNAARWRERHAGLETVYGDVVRHWTARAGAAHDLLEHTHHTAMEMTHDT